MNSYQNSLLEQVKQQAEGNWLQIHKALGIPSAYLNPRKHSPCPSCGGRDRCRYTNWQNKGGFICNQCAPSGGSGFDLLMIANKWDFRQTLKAIANHLHIDPTAKQTYYQTPIISPIEQENPTERKAKETAKLQRLWEEAHPLQPSDPVWLYLTQRGIPPSALEGINDIRHHPLLEYWHNSQPQGKHPAMISKISDNNGALKGLHLTYLQSTYQRNYGEDGEHIPQMDKLRLNIGGELPSRKMRTICAGATTGASVKIHPYTDSLAIAEGIETALSVRALTGLPCHASLSAHGMKHLEIPKQIKTLYIIADNDQNGVGGQAMRELAIRAYKEKKEVHTWTPKDIGEDANDYLNRVGA